MKSILTTTFLGMFLTFLYLPVHAVTKLWIGASGSNWNTGTNWSPSGAPGTIDDVQFTSATSVVLDVNPSVNSILVNASGGVVEFTATAARTITLSSTSAITQGLLITAGTTFQLAPSAVGQMKLSLTGGSGVTADIYGTLNLSGSVAGASPTLEIFSGIFSFGNVKVYDGGKIICDVNSGNTIGFGTSNLQMEAGSEYRVWRNGGTMPNGTYKNGSRIVIRGVISNMFSLNSSALYQGVIEWNCTGQTISAGSASLSLGSSYTIDSLVVTSTGATGTLRLATEMSSSPAINTIQVDGGILEMASPRSANRTMTINNNLVITGGTVQVNATDATDIFAVYNMAVIVSGSLVQSGGTLNLSNRPNGSGGTYGVGTLNIKGDLQQSGGLITETGAVPPVADVSTLLLSGTSPQSLSLNTWTNQVRLQVTNTTGVSLQTSTTCPDSLSIPAPGAYIALGNNTLSVAQPFSVINYNNINPAKIVTNGTGRFELTGVGSGATAAFPVSPFAQSISTVLVKNNGAANNFQARVERGNNPTGIFNTGRTVNRTWIINDATNIASGSAELTFMYPDTALNPSCVRSGAMELGHFPVSAWNVDPSGTTRVPVQGAGVNTTDTTGTFAPNSLDSAFVLGNEGSILTLQKGIAIRYLNGQRQREQHLLHWAVYCTSNEARFAIQRSKDGRHFTDIGQLTASYTRCLQPFDFSDMQPLPGLNYYRIKTIDIDGSITYSTTILLQDKRTAPGSLTLQPTLVQQPLALLWVDAVNTTAATIAITDVSGKTVALQSAGLLAGSNQLTLNLGNLPPGHYQLTLIAKGQEWPVVRFVKQ
jgi:hypothetical protein